MVLTETLLLKHYCGVQNYSVSGFIIFELFTVIFFQDRAGWGMFTVIPGNPRRTKGNSLHLEARPELQDWPRSELFTVKNSRTVFTVKNSRTGPFSNYFGNNFELYSITAVKVLEGFLEGSVLQKVLRRQKHVLSQSMTPFACTLLSSTDWP